MPSDLFLANGNNFAGCQFSSLERRRDSSDPMTLLRWKRADRESGPQTSAFEDLALPLFPSLYNVAFWLCRNSTEAEDLVQETFLKALRGFPSFEAGTNFKSWIFRILRNTYLTFRTGLAAMRPVALEGELGQSEEFGPGLH